MAQFLKQIPTNLTEYPNSFKRQGAFPLEAYSVFYTKTEADNYAASDPLAYVGQTIAVALDNAVTLYVIDQTSKLKEVGSLPVGDDQSIKVIDGKIQLAGFKDAVNGAVAQIEVAEDGTKTLVWTQASELVRGEMADIIANVEDHGERITSLEDVINTDTVAPGTDTVTQKALVKSVASVDYANGEYILKDTKGNEVSRIKIAEAVTNFAYHASYPGKDGKTYDNVLVLELSDGEEQIIEIEDLVKIYDVEKNATEVQVTITPSTGLTDENDPSSDQPNIISAKLTDTVKTDIAKGVKAHDAITHEESDVEFKPVEDKYLVAIKEGRITTTQLEQSIANKLGAINAEGKVDGSNVSGPVAEATTANKVAQALTVGVGTKKSYNGSDTLDVAFDTNVFADTGANEQQLIIGLNTDTVFVLNGGDAAGHTPATNESTEV